MNRVGYARGNPERLERQRDRIHAVGVDRMFYDATETVAGLNDLVATMPRGTTVVVTSPDRLGCTPSGIGQVIASLRAAGIDIEVVGQVHSDHHQGALLDLLLALDKT